MTTFIEKERAALLERQEQKLKPPSHFRVMLLDDDFTPMDYVVMVLQHYFHKDLKTATEIMLQVHIEGKGVCGIYTRDIAATKIEQVTSNARQAGHPLQCTMEEI